MEARRGRPPYPGAVTPSEQRVLELLRTGLTNAEIAVRLGLSVNTVRYHVTNLLTKANAQTRTELREWVPDRSRWNPLKLMAPLSAPLRLLLATGGVAGIVVVGIAAAAVIGSFRGESNVPAVADEPTGVTQERPRLGEGRVPPVETVALIDWMAETLQIINTTTGDTISSVATGYRPMVTFRRSTNELLLAHRPADGSSGELQDYVLDVLDIANGLALKARIETPYRPTPKVASPSTWMTLSRDDRYYAYSSMTMRTELPECQGTSVDGPSCARTVVNIVDLEAPETQPWQFELPRYCGVGLFQPIGNDAIGVSCIDGTTFTFSSEGQGGNSGSVSPSFQVKLVTVTGGNPMLQVSSDDGWSGALLSSGAFVWARAGSPSLRYRSIPDGQTLRFPIYAEVGGGRIVAGFVPSTGVQYPEGLTVFDMVDGVIERTLPGYDISRSLIATGPDTLLATTLDGRLIEINVDTGTERTLTTLNADPENVELVR